MRNRDVVGPGRHADAEPGNVRRIGRQIGAHVGDNVELEREETALVVDGQPRGRNIVAAVAVGEEVLGALADPFDRLAQAFGGDRGERIFAIGKQLGAKAATDIGRDDAHLVRRQLHDVAGDDVADDVAALAADRQRVAVAVEFGDHAAGVEIIGDQPLVDDGELDDLCSLGEGISGGGRVADGDLEGKIAAPVGPDLRRALFQRVDGTGDMRQRMPVDLDRLGGIFCGRQRVGHDEGDGIPDIARDLARENWVRRDLDLDVGHHARRRQGSEMADVGGGQHQADAGHRAHAAEVADPETGMGMRRAHHDRMQAGCRLDIGDVAPRPAQQRVVFLARERLAESELHCHLRPSAFVGCLEGSCCPRRDDKCTAIQRVTT